MPVSPIRGIRTFRYAVFFDGVDDYARIEPFIVYGWSEITIQEWIYAYHPKANLEASKFNMIGSYGVDLVAFLHTTDGKFDYTVLDIVWATRKPDNTRQDYAFSWYAYRNRWVNLAVGFTTTRELSFWVNGAKVSSASVPSNYITILEMDPKTATYPDRFTRFVLGANVLFYERITMMQSSLLIYSRALSEDEIIHNMVYPWNPVRDGLKVWLLAHPDHVRDIDGDGVLEWVDLSGNGNHAKLYGARLVEIIKTPSRILTPMRATPVVR